ncbi:sulfite exporter TauE/SafE family protein [soil metagenome]
MTPEGLLVSLVAVTLGAAIQGSIGFGFALIAVPTLTFIRADALPATLLLLAVPMTIAMALRERSAIDVSGFLHATAGRVFGVAGGVGLLVVVPSDSLAILVGAIILAAVAMSVVAPDVDPTRATTLAAGFASGIMGTAAAIGGPPMALAYQGRPGSELRSTLAASFVVGGLMSIAGLFLAGKVRGWHSMLALQLLPGVVVGLGLSRYVLGSLDRRWLRPTVLTFAAVAGAAAIVRGFVG